MKFCHRLSFIDNKIEFLDGEAGKHTHHIWQFPVITSNAMTMCFVCL